MDHMTVGAARLERLYRPLFGLRRLVHGEDLVLQ